MAGKTDNYHGLLLLDKPSGISSHDAVMKVRRVYKQRGVGHTGTLDPLAEGLLVLCLGRATKIAQFLTGHEKTYEAVVEFGRESVTFDREGVDDSKPATPVPAIDDWNLLLEPFRGQITQTVPAYSAVQVNGERLYQKARKGEEVELPQREVEIHQLEVRKYDPPLLHLTITCSAGTYIRSLAHDIGQALGCGAYLHSLRRTRVGGFDLDQAHNLEDLRNARGEDLLDFLLPLSAGLQFPRVTIAPEHVEYIGQGRDLECRFFLDLSAEFSCDEFVVIDDTQSTPLAIVRAEVDSTELESHSGRAFKYVRVLN